MRYTTEIENEIIAHKQTIAEIKTSLVSDVIETKQNGRKLDFIRKNKNVSKETSGMMETKQWSDLLEQRIIQATNSFAEMNANLEEQGQKLAFLHGKVKKWSDRCQQYEKPFSEMQRMKDLKSKIKELQDKVEKDRVD